MNTNKILELLRAELKKRLKNVRDYMNGAGMRYKGPKYYKAQGKESAYDALLNVIDSLQQEQPEVDLWKFTEKMNAWKARYNYPDNIPIKAAMAFTARMFYQYPNVARQWYDSLPKVTMD